MVPVTWYHGTRRGFTPGGYLFPATLHGAATRAGVNDPAYIYFTDDWDQAVFYAMNTKGRGKPKVLTLEVYGDVERDPSPYDYEDDQYRSTGHALVKKVTCLQQDPVVE